MSLSPPRHRLHLITNGAGWTLPVVQPTETIPSATERRLSLAAAAAQEGDTAARDALFAALRPRLARQAHRFRRGRWGALAGRAWEQADVEQELYLVFADLLAAWPRQSSFPTYLLGHFGWRLRAAVRRLHGSAPRCVRLDPRCLLADESAEAERARALLRAVAADLDPLDGQILLLTVLDGESPGAIAYRLQVNRRHVRRRWLVLTAALRRSLVDDGRDDDPRRGPGAAPERGWRADWDRPAGEKGG